MRVRALRKIGGITPMKSGEDFYLLQKLRKMGYVSNWCGGVAFPAARFSERVFFGTGPAMVKGRAGNWESYPIYHHLLFQEIKHNYDLIPQLFSENITTDFITFLENQFRDADLWSPLRKNATSVERFSRAFHEKADGLRILQYLKQKQNLGAQYAVTQLFFDNEKYFSFVEKARAMGITIPIIPGIKPLAKLSQLTVVPKTFHCDIPEPLAKEIVKCKTDDDARQLGIEWTTEQCRDLYAHGVNNIHFYTVSAVDSVAEVAKRLL